MNLKLAAKVMDHLRDLGVFEVCLCAGARNSPFVVLLDENKEAFRLYNFFDERAASFFAIGRQKATQRPLAIITTSGTAVAELLPACIEAYYSGVPLVMVTADRPKTYRNSGAPQTINQPGIFSHYTELEFDLDSLGQKISLHSWSRKKPIHINVCFDEPLIAGEIPRLALNSAQVALKLEGASGPNAIPNSITHSTEEWALNNPLVVISGLDQRYRQEVKDFLLTHRLPFFAEVLSGLQGDRELRHLQITNGDVLFIEAAKRGYFKSILRIGGVPTFRFWRDLETKYNELPVFSISEGPWTGLSRESTLTQKFDQLRNIRFDFSDQLSSLQHRSEVFRAELNSLFEQFPNSEQALVHKYSSIVEGQRLYVGNSLPIREWDSYASTTKLSEVFGHRGANGIDGQLSSFLGWCSDNEANWSLFGDLTTMYDLSAPWISDQISAKRIAIGIMNNSGGQIFNKMFSRELFLNQHKIHFEKWAEMWGWKYERWSHIPNQWELRSRVIIEMLPDPKQTFGFQKQMEQLGCDIWS